MNYVFFHYHLLPGGVTTSIVHCIKSLRHNLTASDTITVVCGREQNVSKIATAISDNNYPCAIKLLHTHHNINLANKVNFIIHPAFDYNSGTAYTSFRLRKKLTSILSGLIGVEYLWWIHNYHLGKNCAFTNAIIDICNQHPQQKMVLHIHDFPEDGRAKNFNTLKKRVKGTMYPVSPSVVYCAINPQDHQMLTSILNNPDKTYLLINPVTTNKKMERHAPLAEQKKSQIAHALSSLTSSPHCHGTMVPDSYTVIYPVRTIRRKNILEAGLLMRCSRHYLKNIYSGSSADPAKQDINLIVTLPGLSKQERKYSSTVASCFKDGHIPGIWGVGTILPSLSFSYQQLLQYSDLLLSTSIQEGFGYSMIEAILCNKPYVIRHLPTLEICKKYFDTNQLSAYSTIEIPWSIEPLRTSKHTLYRQYRKKVHNDKQIVAHGCIEKLMDDLDAMFDATSIDFAYLSIKTQVALLQSKNFDIIEQITQHNMSIVEQTVGHLTKSHIFNSHGDTLQSDYSVDTFNTHFMNAVAQTSKSNIAQKPTGNTIDIDFKIYQHFCNLPSWRLLLS